MATLPLLLLLTLVNVVLLFWTDGLGLSPRSKRVRPDGSVLPSLSIQCRLFGGRLQEAWDGLIPSMQLFLPWQDAYRAWPGLEVALIWDGEAQLDQHAATLLSSLPPYPRAFLEAPCPPTVCMNSIGRGAGYSRQQYSNFWGDLYTNASLIGFVDSDNVFASPLIPSAVVSPTTGKPIILAYQSEDYSATFLNGTDRVKLAIGHRVIIARMVSSTLPVFIRTQDLRPMREFIVRHMGVRDFGEAWGVLGHGQFDIMANWLWWHRRDEYEWHLKDLGMNPSYGWWRSGAHAANLEGDFEGGIALASTNTPLPFLIKNAGHDKIFLPVLAEYICLALRTSPPPRGACDASASVRAGQLVLEWEDWLLRSLRSDNNNEWAAFLPPRGYPDALAQAPLGNQDKYKEYPMDRDWDLYTGLAEGVSWLSIYEGRERDFLAFKAAHQRVGGTGILPFAPITAQGRLCTPWEEESGKEKGKGGGCSPQGVFV